VFGITETETFEQFVAVLKIKLILNLFLPLETVQVQQSTIFLWTEGKCRAFLFMNIFIKSTN